MRALAENWQRSGFGLYIHWPFCAAKCPYCDFNSHVAASIDQERWKRAYLSEIRRISAETPGRVLRSIFFGGGTPSLMTPELVGVVIDAAARAWSFANDIEITLEANPSSVERDRFAGFAEMGVNRVSLGVQALNDEDLRRLGRLHSTEDALRALDIANGTFDRVSFDMIYARQHQTLEDWRKELGRALSMTTGHLSLYQLTIEPGTAFGDRHARGRLPGLPDEDLGADMYELTQSMTKAAGLPAYEISNHAAPGQESRHNMIYWQGGDYAGIGPGAHGRLTFDGGRFAATTKLAPGAWLEQVEKERSGEDTRERLSAVEDLRERVMMGLRTIDGIALEADGWSQEKLYNINDLERSGLLSVDGGCLRLTEAGRPLLNSVLREILP
jgi:oxygen-independent coproporphyrinogen-3 oxidase